MATTTYTITLIDQASAAANRVRTALARVAVTTSATAQALRTGSKAEQAFARDAEKLARVELRAAKSIMSATKAVDRFNGTARKSAGILAGVRGAAAGLAGVFSAHLIGATIRTGRELLEAAGNAQILERNFARVTGDPRELEQTRALIKGIGLDLEAGEKAALKLRTSFGRVTAESLLKTFSALSLGADEVQRASLALSQIQGRGKLQAEELNQFIEAVPGVDRGAIIDQIAKELKISTQEAGARLGKGQIAADVGIRGLIFGALESQKLGQGDGTRGFGGVDKAIAAGANDINRQLTALDNTILEVKRNFGAAIASPAVIGGLKAIGSALQTISEMDPALLRAIALGVGGITIAFGALGAVAGYLAIVSAGVGVLTGTLIPAAVAAWSFIAPFLVAAAPFIAAGAALAFLGYQISQLWKELGGWEVIWPAVKGFFTNLANTALDLGAQALDWGRNIVQGLVDGITGGVGKAVDAVTGLGSSVIAGAKDVFGIESPSKVFAEQGRFIDEGLAMGIEDHQDLALASAESMADGVVSEAEMTAATGSGVNQTAMANVGAAAGNALAAPAARAGGTVGAVNVVINVDGSQDTATTMQAIRNFFDTDFAALLERQLEAQGA